MREHRPFTLPAAEPTPPRAFGVAALAQALFVGALIAFRIGITDAPERAAAFVLDIPALPRETTHENDQAVKRGQEPPPLRMPDRVAMAAASDSLPVVAGVTGDATLRPVTPESLVAGDSRGRADATRLANMGPHYGDGRVWVRPFSLGESPGVDRPLDMDSIVRRRLFAMADSIERNPTSDPYRLPSWTFQRDGRTYGLDSTGLHLGPITIPAALLALVPLPQGNIDQARANARLALMRADIMRAAARAQAEDDFRRAVREIRERNDRERRERRERDQARPRATP